VNGSTRTRAAKTPLPKAIKGYLADQEGKLNESARELLARLAKHSHSRRAFDRLKLKNRCDEAAFLATCIAADELARSFSKRILGAQKAVSRMERLSEAVALLREFVKKLESDQFYPVIGDSNKAMHNGLYWIDDRIGTIRRLAKEDQLRLGATRSNGLTKKSSANDGTESIAPQNAAIGWLADGVRRITGKAHMKAVTELAKVILRTTLTEDRVRAASRVRKRDWRYHM
jgi:hypothetical protein